MQNLLPEETSPCMFLISRPYSTGGYVSTAPTQEDQILEKTVRELSISIRESLVLTQEQEPANAREIVLRKCAQTEPLPFAECYPDT